MADQWPPPAPGVNKAFKKAHDAMNDNVSPPPLPMVTKKEVEELEAHRKKMQPVLSLTPKGLKRNAAADRELEKSNTTVDRELQQRIARMKERLQKAKDRTRDDFGRSR